MIPSSAPVARNGVALVVASAIVWSFGGTIARFIAETDSWAIVFWRSYVATTFLLCFLVGRDGAEETGRVFKAMGWAGLAVALCFAVASTSFVVALTYTTVANILLIQAGVPLLAALMSWFVYGERASVSTWIAIAAVISGVAVMVSESLTGTVSPIGDGLSLLIAAAFATATVITRRHSNIRMTAAVCAGTAMACVVSGFMTTNFFVSGADFLWLIAFGALNLGLGLAMFSIGARLIPAALAALIGVLEPVLGPIWVWIVHGEVPHSRTLLGGSIVFAALIAHLTLEWLRQRAPRPV